VAVEVALVGEANGEGDVGERELRVAEHLFDVLESAAEKIAMRGYAKRLLEGAGEMVGGEAGHGGECVEADLFADVRLDEIADAVFHCGRKAASARVWGFGHRHKVEHAEAWLGMNNRFGPAAGEIRFRERRSDQGTPLIVAPRAGEENRNVLATAAAEEGKAVVEERGQRDAGGQPIVIESEGGTRNAVCATDALVIIQSQEHGRSGVAGR